MRVVWLPWLILMGTPLVARAAEPAAAYAALNVSPKKVQFSKRATAQGDRVDHAVRVALNLHSTVRQGGEVVQEASTTLDRNQQRTIIAEEVLDGKTVAARVRFQRSERTIDESAPESHPIVGHTYYCRRVADEPLQIRRDDGSLPSLEEHRLVSESMESLGRSNPLADFFAGRRIEVGERLELPEEVGEALLGNGPTLGKVSRFVLTLREVVDRHGEQVARFDALVEAQGADRTQMRMELTGTLELEVDTCRTRLLDLSGPLGMATTIGSYSQEQTTFVRGKLNLKMTADYGK